VFKPKQELSLELNGEMNLRGWKGYQPRRNQSSNTKYDVSYKGNMYT